MTSLVLVAGHAIPRDLHALDSDSGWYLKHFQRGEGKFYVDHVRHGVRLAAADPDSLLLFAGGQTDREAGPRSEAQGYWRIAEHFNWFNTLEVRERASTEEFSMDSLENLLFGICRFKEFTGSLPERIAVTGWSFKEPRFRMHCAALEFPPENFRYDGIGDPPELEKHLPSEERRRALFAKDPLGRSPEAMVKKRERNFGRRRHGYLQSCPEMARFLTA